MKKLLCIAIALSSALIAKDTRGMNLTWIVVDDLNAAVEFYSQTVGLKCAEIYPEMGWAEMEGTDGARLGLAQACGEIQAGTNGVFTITVDDIEATSNAFAEKGAIRIGGVCEVPGICKLQLFTDCDGNQFQLHQDLG